MLKGFLFGIGFMIAVFFSLVVVGSIGVWQLSKTWEELYTRYHRDENAVVSNPATETRLQPNLLPAKTVQNTLGADEPQALPSSGPASATDKRREFTSTAATVSKCLDDVNNDCLIKPNGDLDPNMSDSEIFQECILTNYDGSATAAVAACATPLATWQKRPTFQREWDKLIARDRAIRDIISTYHVAKKARSGT